MSRSAKILVYVGLSLCALVFAWSFGIELRHVLHAAAEASKPKMIAALAGLIGILAVLGLLGALDLSGKLGRRSHLWALDATDPSLAATALEAAENLRKRGESLEAIRQLREFLQEHPGESEVMARIAEIYNYDLKNYLAAALEYEELMKHRLTDEDWGWAALHLAKLYGRLNQPDKALTLLEKLDNEYGETLAARRARKVREQHSEEPSEPEPPTDSP